MYSLTAASNSAMFFMRLTKKAEPPPTRGVNRDSGTDRANGGWLRRLVRCHGHTTKKATKTTIKNTITIMERHPLREVSLL
jgi:hypothetical protein